MGTAAPLPDVIGTAQRVRESNGHLIDRIDHPVDRIIVSGETAVVVGEMYADITAGGARKTLANRSVAARAHDRDRWLLLAYQPTVLSEEDVR
ncbi:hypothetical protein [Streptomyces sp. NPDC059349]|uniref:hypothetical protein n=1 Tax=Streptomyces sp. NPDC059349 TaxID=3346808 RepID=UPI00367CB04D